MPEKIKVHTEQELTRIDRIDLEESIEALEDKGELTPEVRRDIRIVERQGVIPDHLTPTEITGIRNFMEDNSPKTVEKKTELIMGLLSDAMNGVRNRRDYLPFNPERSRHLDSLRSRAVDFDRRVDQEGMPDQDELLREFLCKTDQEIQDSIFHDEDGEDFDDILSASTLSMIKSDFGLDDEFNGVTVQDIAESDYYEILNYAPTLGGWSQADLDAIAEFARPTWSKPSSQRSGSALANYLTFAKSSIDNLDEAFLQYYVEREILPNHQLNAQDVTVVFTAYCQDLIKSGQLEDFDEQTRPSKVAEQVDEDFNEPNDEPEAPEEEHSNTDLRKDYRSMKRSIEEGVRYARELCGIRKESFKEKFGSEKPVKLEALEFLQTEAESWTDGRIEVLSKESVATCAKLLEHYFKIRSIRTRLAQFNSNEGLADDGHALPDGVFGVSDLGE